MIGEDYSQELVEIAKRRFQLLAYIQERGAIPAQKNSGEWVLGCPRCGKLKLVVNVDTKMWHCWVCYKRGPMRPDGTYKVLAGAGSVIELVAELEGVDRKEALVRVLSGQHWTATDLAGLPVEEMSVVAQAAAQEAPTIPFPEGSQKIVDADMEYLLRRGISKAHVERYGLWVCHSGRYAGRLMFPVYEGGRLVYYQGRAMREAYPGERHFLKSLNPPKELGCAPSSELLMNLDVARSYPRVAITEGPIDAIHAGPSAVCSFGKHVTMVQLGKLLRAGVRCVDLMWDADAIVDMEVVRPLLAQFFDVRVVRLPSGDPGNYPQGQLDAWRAQARPALSPLQRV